jgi:hypothetical protein
MSQPSIPPKQTRKGPALNKKGRATAAKAGPKGSLEIAGTVEQLQNDKRFGEQIVKVAQGRGAPSRPSSPSPSAPTAPNSDDFFPPLPDDPLNPPPDSVSTK